MADYFEGLSLMEKIFFISSILGGMGMGVRLVLQFAGGIDADADVDVGDVGDMGDIDAHADVSASDTSFHLLSLQGIMGFFLMFGLVGLAMMKQSKMSSGTSLLGGAAAGTASLWIVAKMFSWMKSLQSSGTIDIKTAIGSEGKVYLTIPASGTGKVEALIQGRLKIYDAVSEGDVEFKTGDAVKIVRIEGGSIMVVGRP